MEDQSSNTWLRRLRRTVKVKVEEDIYVSDVTTRTNFCTKFALYFAVLVRCVMIGWCVFIIYLTVDLKDESYWAMLVPAVLIVVEGVYTIWQRGGHERKW